MTGCPTCPETEHECRNWDWSGHCVECGEKTLPEWERELLSQPRPAQPDRPGPVDPSEVRVGDVVEVEADDESWMVRGRVGDIDDTIGESYLPICIEHPNGEIIWIDARESGAIVRILRRTEPEPDPAAMEALAKLLAEIDGVSSEFEPRLLARELVRRGVHVEVPDDQ